MSNTSKVQVAIAQLDPTKLGIVLGIIITVVILIANPWTFVWYPPLTLGIGALISWIATTIIEQIQAIVAAEVNS